MMDVLTGFLTILMCLCTLVAVPLGIGCLVIRIGNNWTIHQGMAEGADQYERKRAKEMLRQRRLFRQWALGGFRAPKEPQGGEKE